MKILALDPGYDRLGIAVMEHKDKKEFLIFSDCILTDKKTELADRIHHIGVSIQFLLDKYKPDAVAIETLFFNKNIKTAIGVAEVRGVAVFLSRKAGCVVFEYGPQEIKVAVTGYGKSDKCAVINMVKRLIKNAPEKAYDDEYDAIAVGITALAQNRS